jgi:hypothetical protein
VTGTAGQLLAIATGTTGRTTFFDMWSSMPVLLTPNTPALPPPSSTPQSPPSTRGLALLNIEWYDCHQPRAASLTLSLPGAAGSFHVGFNVTGAYSPACWPGHLVPATLNRGAFAPTGATPATEVVIDVTADMFTQTAARPASTLVFYVRLTNVDRTTYTLDPCPDYTEFLANKQPFGSFQLNCATAGPIAPGRAITFEMRLALPSTTPVGLTQLSWSLQDSRAGDPSATESVFVQGP